MQVEAPHVWQSHREDQKQFRHVETAVRCMIWLTPYLQYEGTMASQKFSEVLRSCLPSEASSQKFSEYIQNGCPKEAKTIQNILLGAAKRPQKAILLSLAFFRQSFCIYCIYFVYRFQPPPSFHPPCD